MKMIRIAAAVLVCLAMVHSADAQSGKRTKVRFNAPIEIPNPSTKSGVMTLPPGEYLVHGKLDLLGQSTSEEAFVVCNLTIDGTAGSTPGSLRSGRCIRIAGRPF